MSDQKQPPVRAGNGERLVVYQHSDLLYWWVVWAYGLLCALLTRLAGEPVRYLVLGTGQERWRWRGTMAASPCMRVMRAQRDTSSSLMSVPALRPEKET